VFEYSKNFLVSRKRSRLMQDAFEVNAFSLESGWQTSEKAKEQRC
jgi:hypothetical protein